MITQHTTKETACQNSERPSVVIDTIRCSDGSFSWEYTWEEVLYFDHDFITRESAKDDAKSHFRALMKGKGL